MKKVEFHQVNLSILLLKNNFIKGNVLNKSDYDKILPKDNQLIDKGAYGSLRDIGLN